MIFTQKSPKNFWQLALGEVIGGSCRRCGVVGA